MAAESSLAIKSEEMGVVGMVSRRVKYGTNCILVSLLLIGLLIVPLSSLISTVFAAPTTVLTPKWSRSGLGTNWEGGLVLGDVTGDGVEDVVFGGGSTHTIYVLSGTNGNTIATYTNSRIGTYCQPQLYDVDGDGVLDIVIPLFSRAGIAVIQYNGSPTLHELWVRDVQGTTGSGSCMSKIVAGDINGDGHLEIFIGSQDVSPLGGYDGTITKFDYLGNILAQTFAWRPCSGGLSLADTDNDGVFELYMGDRGIYYGDGNYGQGVRSLWADNLTSRWNRLDFLSSSQAPVLVDINHDGILEVLAGMYREMNILNSTNGATIQRYSDNTMSVHYGFTVSDIDGDGHLELLASDGDHDDDPYADVYDLVTGQLKAELSLAGGDTKWSPVVADISPSNPGNEIISVPNGTSLNGWHGVIMIYDSNFQSIQNVTTPNMSVQLGYPIVQDIDGDGLLELVTDASSGSVYAFDTSAPAPGHNQVALPGSQRIRSEVTYYGEARLDVAEHTILPWAPNYWTAPLVAPVSPGDNSLKVPQSTTSLSFRLRDHQSHSMTYNVTTSPGIGNASGSSIGNPYNWTVYTLNFNQTLQYDTTYQWTVSASDGTNVTTRTYTFRTELAPNAGNSVPTQADPTLVAQDGLGTATSTFVSANGSTTDVNGDKVTNIYEWAVNGQQVADLILPFDTRNETVTKDYSAYGNNGNVTGATWTPNGIVGGAYSFDGKDDAIIISDGGAGYYDNKTHSDYNPELGGGGTWTQISVEAWIYLTQYNNGSRIVAKYPSYEIGFQSGYTNRLTASVYPQLGLIGQTDGNNASTDKAQTVTATVNIALNTWYHIAFTYQSGIGLKLYLNGVMVKQATGIVGPLENSLGSPVYIGRLVQPFAGMIDEVRIYPYALSSTQINNSYLATKDGLSTSSLFNPTGIAAPGATLSCTVIPTDSYGDGLPHSASITLKNNPPVASNLNVYPVRDRNTRLDGENLGANYTYFDADGQAETGSQISWYRNGVNQTALYGRVEVPAATTQIGEQWYFNVTPRDSGGALGVPQVSPTVTIRGNTAPSTGVPTLDSMNGGTDYDDEDLAATAATTTDGDSPPDATTNIFHWTQNGVSQTNLQMPFDTEVPGIPNATGATKDYSGYGNNGVVNGSSWVQDGVVGGALSFDGNDYVTVHENGSTLGGDGSWSQISVEFWIRATGATTSTQTVVFKPDTLYSPGASSYGLGYRVQYRYYADSYRVYWIVGNNTAQISLNARVYEGPDQWHHVVCTYQSGVGLKIYTDGLLRASMAATGNINATLGGLLYLGGINSGTGDFIGQMDEVRIYPHALSDAQIFQRFIDTKDGLSGNSDIVPQETSAGDNWTCQVIPNDSWQDGTAKTSNSLHVDAVSGNSRPRIDRYSTNTTSVNEGASLNFWQVSSDPDGDPLSYSWTLDSVPQATTQNWTYSPDFTSQGLHTVRVTVSDASLSDSQDWSVNVIDVSNIFHNLTVLPSSNGNTSPAPGTYQYGENTNASVSAIPNLNYVLSKWLLNNTDYGATNPCTVNMTSDFNLTAVFVVKPPVIYNLTIGTSGFGTTNPIPGTYQYNENTNASVQANPTAGNVLSYWLLNNTPAGSVNPYNLNMTANYNLTAVFAPIPYNLIIGVSGSGNTNPAPGIYQYTPYVNVSVLANANTGQILSQWLLNGSDAGSINPYVVNMTGNWNLTAVFVPIQYTLTISTVGSGTVTISPNQTTYAYGTNVTLTANANSNWTFAGWTGDMTGTASPTTLNMTGNKTVTATFIQNQYMFSDGFESGTFSAWPSTTVTTGETATVVNSRSYAGTYSGQFTSNGGLSYERAYASRSITSSSELYARGYFYVSQSGIADNTDRFYFMMFMSGSNILAYAGWRQNNGVVYWNLMIRDGTNTVGVYSVVSPSLNKWYSVELHWKQNSTSGLGELYVDGVLVCSLINRNTANYGGATTIRFGLPEIYNCASTTAYVDNAVISTTYIGPESPPLQYTLTIAADGSGTTLPSIGNYTYANGTIVPVTATANSGWKLDHWNLDGSNFTAANQFNVTMTANHTITAVFTPSVTNYTLVIQTSVNGTTIPAPNNYTYLEGTIVPVNAVPDAGYKLDHWLLNSTNVGSANPYNVTINGNISLTAVFAPVPTSIFEDGFESGSTSAWNSTTTATSGETVAASSEQAYDGTFSLKSTSNGTVGTESARVNEAFLPTLGEVYVQGHFKLTQNGIAANGARIKLIELRAGSTVVAAAGLYQSGGTLRWWMETRNGTGWIETYSTPIGSFDLTQWFSVELYWKLGATNGGGTLWVNGTQIYQISNIDTDNYGNFSALRFGLAELTNCASTTTYADNCVVSPTYIEP